MRRLLLMCFVLNACSIPAITPKPLLADFPVPSPIHAGVLQDRPATQPFRFLVAGHLYGDSRKAESPAATFVAAVDGLARDDLDLMICCGDTFRYSTNACFTETTAAMSRLPFPVYNTVGNHDVAVRANYERRFGVTYGGFVHAGCAFLLLDTELEAWDIRGQQLQFLREALAAAKARPDIRAVFCFGHKLVHCHRQRYFEVLVGSNGFDGLRGPNHFAADVLPLLADVAKAKPVYWFGGDIGLQHTLPAFFDRDPVHGVYSLATGIGDDPRDAVLEVVVVGSDVQVEMRPLVAGQHDDLANYGLHRWRKRFFPIGMTPQLTALRALLAQ